VATHHFFCPKYSLEVSEVHTISINFELTDWRFLIIDYVMHGIFPDDPGKQCMIDEDLLGSI